MGAKQPVAPPQAKSFATATLMVTVKDAPSGKGLEGVLLEVVGLRGGDKNGKENEIRTDKAGKKTIAGMPADRVWVIKASKKGFGRVANFAPDTFAEVRIETPAQASVHKVELELTASTRLTVKVTSPKRKVPIEGADVVVDGVGSKKTNAKGIADFGPVSIFKPLSTSELLDFFTVKVQKPRFLAEGNKTEEKVFAKPKPGLVTEAEVHLTGTSRLVVTVTDTGGDPVPDAELEVVGLAGGQGKGVKTDAKGKKDLGELELFTEAAPHQPISWDVKAFKKDFGPVVKAGGTFAEGPARRDPDPVFKPEPDAVVNVAIKMQPAAKKAEVVSHKPFKVHKQFVNLPADPKKPEQGSKLTLKVQLKGGKKGETVFAKLEPGDNNSKRNSPLPGFTGQVKESWCPKGGVRAQMREDAGKKDSEALIELECGLAGGDFFSVKVGGDEKCADQELSFVTWRRVVYQLTKLPAQKPTFPLAEQIMRSAFIEIVKGKEVALKVGEGPSGIRNWIGSDLILGKQNKSHFTAKWTQGTLPGFHVVICSAITFAADTPGLVSTIVNGATNAVTINAPANVFFFDPGLNGAFVDIVAWGVSDAAGNVASTAPQGQLPAANVSIANQGARQLTVRLDAAAKAQLAAGNRIKVGARVRFSIGNFGGMTFGDSPGQIFLIMGGSSEHAMIHELGHLLKQAVRTAPPGMNLSDHPFVYTGHGHLGPHCHNGYTAPIPADFTATPFETRRTTATCVMFGDDANNGIADGFCEKCLPFIKGTDASAPLQPVLT